MRNTILASGTFTATATTQQYEVGDATSIAVTLSVTAVSGTTPTLDVKIEESADGTIWTTLATFTQKTAIANETIRISNPFHSLIRAVLTVAGTTPSFTAAVKTTTK